MPLVLVIYFPAIPVFQAGVLQQLEIRHAQQMIALAVTLHVHTQYFRVESDHYQIIRLDHHA
ncbi:hypothetical protein D3C81_2100770 [compost metagenome]